MKRPPLFDEEEDEIEKILNDYEVPLPWEKENDKKETQSDNSIRS